MARWISFAIWLSLTLVLAVVVSTAETAAPGAPGTAGTTKPPGIKRSGPPEPAPAAKLSKRNQVRVKVNEAGKTRRDLIEKANPDGSIKK